MRQRVSSSCCAAKFLVLLQLDSDSIHIAKVKHQSAMLRVASYALRFARSMTLRKQLVLVLVLVLDTILNNTSKSTFFDYEDENDDEDDSCNTELPTA